MESELTHLDLFSGIGGFAMAAGWAGFRTIGFVEIDGYCQRVLKKHWPDVPVVEDIRDVEKIKEIVANVSDSTREGCLAEQSEIGIAEQEIRETSAGKSSRTGSLYGDPPALLVTAGFPCQPFSVAGKRQGERDDRYLWPETLAVIKEIKPKWILLENVTGIINLALDTVLSDLEGAGYSHETLIIPACAINAWHRRDRIWIVGYSTGNRSNQVGSISGRQESITRRICADVPNTKSRESREQTEPEGREDSGRGSKEVATADTQREGLEGADTERSLCTAGQPLQSGINSKGNGIQGRRPIIDSPISRDWWAVEPELGRVAHGIPNRVDRLKCLGNAIVPQVAYQILKRIAEIECGQA